MNKKLGFGVFIAVALALGVAFFFWRQQKGEGPVAQGPAIAKEQIAYNVQVKTMYTTPTQNDTVLEMTGKLLVHAQGADGFVSEWDSIAPFTVMNQVMEPGPVLHQQTVSVVEDGELNHYIDPEFPGDFSGFQKEFLSRFFVPVAMQANPEIYRSEREGKNLIRVKYEVKESKEGYAVNRRWIQTLQGMIKVDSKDDGFSYDFDKDGNLIRMSGSLAFHGNDAENNPFKLHTTITIDRSGIQAMAQEKRVLKDRTAMVLVEDKPEQPENPDQLRALADVFRDLDKLTGEDTPQTRADLYIELAKILAAKPESLGEFKNKILTMDTSTGAGQFQASVIFSVISGSETEAGANLLSDLFAKECNNQYCREMAISAYGMHSNVSLESAQQVLQVAETDTNPDISNDAYLGAGAAARMLGDRFSELKPSLFTALQQADAKQDIEKKAFVIRAIGNAGDRAFLPTLIENTKSENDRIKNMSFFAMRFVPGDDVNETLVSSLEKEPDAGVQGEILRSVSLRNFSKDQYDRIAEKAVTWDSDDQDMAVNAINTLLEAYHRNPDDSAAALETVKNKIKIADLRTYTEQGMNPHGFTPNDEGNRAEDEEPSTAPPVPEEEE